MKETDLISRQDAIDAIEEYADRLQMVDWKENPGVPYKAYALNWCINTIRDLPSAQPEIVRCKDCKYRYLDDSVWKCPYGYPFGDFYCAYGEGRRTDE